MGQMEGHVTVRVVVRGGCTNDILDALRAVGLIICVAMRRANRSEMFTVLGYLEKEEHIEQLKKVNGVVEAQVI